MSLSVAYWTSALFPEMEAIAGEVALLRRHFRPSIAWGISSARWLQLSWRRGFGVHPRMHWLFRGATWALQRAFRVNHIFGGLGDWFHLTAASKRPTVLTVATESAACDRSLLDRVDRFGVEWPGARDSLLRMGIDPERIDLIFPPVDLVRFTPGGFADGPPTVLFASSPDRADWLEARGVKLLLDLAGLMPKVQFRLLWRPWGTAFPQVQEWIRKRELVNVELRREKVVDMAAEYGQVHVTIAPFTDMSRCKAVPNSLLESLACGVPVVVTDLVGLAEIIESENCGRVAAANPNRLCDAVEQVLATQKKLRAAARAAAENWFSAAGFIECYRRMYAQVI